MKIQTLSILTGSAACNAKCPFCVSKMTHSGGVNIKSHEINWHNFKVACKLADRAGVTTAMLTGKGEPTLWPKQIESYLIALNGMFPFVELQTNGLTIANDTIDLHTLKYWRQLGLTTIAVSVAHFNEYYNKEIYIGSNSNKSYPSIDVFANKIHMAGLSMRLNCVMLKGFVDDWLDIDEFLNLVRLLGIEQFTLIPVNKPADKVKETCEEVYDWTVSHGLDRSDVSIIKAHLDKAGTQVLQLAHGAVVYDVNGQNVCLSNCLKTDGKENADTMRNLIFYPDGHLRYDWAHSGAILL